MPDDRCPIRGCVKNRRGEMCLTHWNRVGGQTKRALWDTLREWQQDERNLEKLVAYGQARLDARREAANG